MSLTVAAVFAIGGLLYVSRQETITDSPSLPTQIPTATLDDLPSRDPNRPAVSLPTGTDVALPAGPVGRCTLRVTNGTSTDAIVKLLDIEMHQVRRLVYIAANEQHLLDGIGPGNCVVQFALGTDWDDEVGRFRRSLSYSEFDRRLHFSETYTDEGVQWSIFELTLHPVVGGNAKTSHIAEGAFFAEGARPR